MTKPRWLSRGWFLLLLALLSLLVSLDGTYRLSAPLRVHSTEREDAKLEVLEPAEGDEVGLVITVRGVTSRPTWAHYVEVDGPSGTPAIQPGPLRVCRTGQLTGRAFIGTAAVGSGQRYNIRLVALKQALTPGSQVLQEGAVFSNAVTVRRSVDGIPVMVFPWPRFK